uniref:Uncharacterized protein n=1 Tax=Apple barna-like virus 1 TaxID=2709742 RepID=A0A6C0X195_9VIRU|nr:MAG: hypothetical protein [Apple barna-like virus 1]
MVSQRTRDRNNRGRDRLNPVPPMTPAPSPVPSPTPTAPIPSAREVSLFNEVTRLTALVNKLQSDMGKIPRVMSYSGRRYASLFGISIPTTPMEWTDDMRVAFNTTETASTDMSYEQFGVFVIRGSRPVWRHRYTSSSISRVAVSEAVGSVGLAVHCARDSSGQILVIWRSE